MSSRDNILKTIGQNKPTLVDLPEIDINEVISFDSLIAQFRETLERIGGKVELPGDAEELSRLLNAPAQDKFVINTMNLSASQFEEVKAMTSYQLAGVDVAFLKGTLAVAENACIWLDENQMVNRLLPFICQHLVILLKADAIVPTMHHAYEKIDVAETGFGSFIAGPSKTADIEQSLVIGAHGARSLTVIFTE